MFQDILKQKSISTYGTAALPEGFSPFAELCYAISFMVPISKTIIKSIAENGPSELYFHNYKTINTYLDNTAMQIVLDLNVSGYDAVYIPASQSTVADGLRGMVSHKAVARLAGLGGVGRSALFLSNEHGPAVRLSTILTNMPLEGAKEISNPCDGCNCCVKACPSGALWGIDYKDGISRDEIIDAKKCSVYMKKRFQNITRGDACGICIAACPKCY